MKPSTIRGAIVAFIIVTVFAWLREKGNRGRSDRRAAA